MTAVLASGSFADVLRTVVGSPEVERLGWTLVHSVWQGLAIGLLLFVVLAATRSRRGARWSNFRYAASLISMLGVVAASIATFVSSADPIRSRPEGLSSREPAAVVGPAAVVVLPPQVVTFETQKASFGPRSLLPASVAVWAGGVLLLSAWQCVGWLQVQRLRRGDDIADASWADALSSVSERLKVRRIVRLVGSANVEVPVVIGVLRPVIVVPIAVLSGLSIAQAEAVLAHELAHVRRHDYLVNLVQSAVETIFFYHPCVWWMSAQVRREREHCCDDLAADACGGVPYARALLALEEHRGPGSRFALAATDGSLSARVRRLLAPSAPRPRTRSATVALVAMACVVLPIGWDRLRVARAEAPVESNPSAVRGATTKPAEKATSIRGEPADRQSGPSDAVTTTGTRTPERDADAGMPEAERLRAAVARIRTEQLADAMVKTEIRIQELSIARGPNDAEVNRLRNLLPQLRGQLDVEVKLAEERDARRAAAADEAKRVKAGKAPLAGEYYVGGHVERVGVYSIAGRDISLRQAITAAGGIDRTFARPSTLRVTIIRRGGVGESETYPVRGVPIDAFLKGERPDVALRPDDQIMIDPIDEPAATTEPATQP